MRRSVFSVSCEFHLDEPGKLRESVTALQAQTQRRLSWGRLEISKTLRSEEDNATWNGLFDRAAEGRM